MKIKLFQNLNRNSISILFILFVIYVTISIRNTVLNDDFVLELCYSGYFSGGVPVSDHLFQHFFLTQILTFFYTYLHSINWYFYLHLFFLVLSFFTILNVLKNSKNKYYILILVGILFFIEYIYFTFTRISFYVTFSGFLFFLKHDKLDKYKLVCSLLMVLLGSIIRPESGFLALILFSLLYISDDNFKKKIVDKSFLKQLIIVFVIPFLILVSHHISNIENSKRFPIAHLAENSLYQSSLFKDVKFDIWDYQRLKNFYFDERLNSEDLVKYVKNNAPKINIKNKVYKSTDSLLYIFLHQRLYIYIFTVLLLQTFLINGNFNKVKFLSIIGFFIVFFIFLNAFFDLRVYKDRVMEPLFFSLIISYYIKDSTFSSKINILIGMFILALFSYMLFFRAIKDKFVKQDVSIKAELNKIYTRLPKGDYIFDPSFFSLKTLLPGNLSGGCIENFKNHQLLALGWAQRSYSTKVFYSKKGVKNMDELLVKSNTTVLLESSQLLLWNNYGEKYLSRNLVPYDSVCINNGQSCYYLANYRPF